jgi:hypothetical protein
MSHPQHQVDQELEQSREQLPKDQRKNASVNHGLASEQGREEQADDAQNQFVHGERLKERLKRLEYWSKHGCSFVAAGAALSFAGPGRTSRSITRRPPGA